MMLLAGPFERIINCFPSALADLDLSPCEICGKPTLDPYPLCIDCTSEQDAQNEQKAEVTNE